MKVEKLSDCVIVIEGVKYFIEREETERFCFSSSLIKAGRISSRKLYLSKIKGSRDNPYGGDYRLSGEYIYHFYWSGLETVETFETLT